MESFSEIVVDFSDFLEFANDKKSIKEKCIDSVEKLQILAEKLNMEENVDVKKMEEGIISAAALKICKLSVDRRLEIGKNI